MLALQIIIACVLCAVIGGIFAFVLNKVDDSPLGISLGWPITLPIFLLLAIVAKTADLLECLESKIKSKRKD